MINLREFMDERSAGHGILADARLTEVRHKIAVRRRRRAVGLTGAAVLVTALAAYAAVPDGAPVRPTPPIGYPATASASTPVSPRPVAGRKIGPFDEYANGYRVVAVAEAPVSAKQSRLSWKVGAPDIGVYTYCPDLPGKDSRLQIEFTIDGAPQSASLSCWSELPQEAPPGEGMRWDMPSVGATATATFTVAGGVGPDTRQGSVFVAVAEKVPFTDYPLPSRPATLAPPQPDDLAGKPGTKLVHSDPADPNKSVTATLVWHRSYDFRIFAQTPGIYQVSINGVRMLTGGVYDYSGHGPRQRCIRRQEDHGLCVPPGLESVQSGTPVTVTVTAQHATGPWLAELRSASPNLSPAN